MEENATVLNTEENVKTNAAESTNGICDPGVYDSIEVFTFKKYETNQ